MSSDGFDWQQAQKIINEKNLKIEALTEENNHLRERLGFPGNDRFAELQKKLDRAVESLKNIGTHTDHGDQEPCSICKIVDDFLASLESKVEG